MLDKVLPPSPRTKTLNSYLPALMRGETVVANDYSVTYVAWAKNGLTTIIHLGKWRKNEDRVRLAGAIARQRARKAGVPAYYRAPSLGYSIVKEMPDGLRFLDDW